MDKYNLGKIGKVIKKRRIELGMSQSDLADALFTERTVISKWERGISIPSANLLINLTEVLNISMDELYGSDGAFDKKTFDEMVKYYIKSTKRLKIIIFLLIVIFLLVGLFGFYYFFSNYKSLEIYNINFPSYKYNVKVLVGKMIKTRDTINFDLVVDNANHLRLYYIDEDNEERLICEVEDNVLDIFERRGYNESFDYDNLDYIIENMYLDIDNDEGSYNVKLELYRMYVNDDIFTVKVSEIGDKDNSVNTNDTKVELTEDMQDVLENTFTKDGDFYYYTFIEDGYEHEIYYNSDTDINMFTYSLYELENNTLVENWDYFLVNKSVFYYKYEKDEILPTFSCNNTESICNEHVDKFYEYFYGIFKEG